MHDQEIRPAIEAYFRGPLDAAREYEWRHEDVVIDMPQSGERIRGRDNLKAMQDVYPNPPQVTLRRIVGSGELWIIEGTGDYGGKVYHGVNILEFRDDKIVRETRYYGEPFEAPAWRAQWVEPIPSEP